MKTHLKALTLFSFFIILTSCGDNQKERLTRLVNEWQGKEILFPKEITFTQYIKDTVEYTIPASDYKVLVYIDSVGCTSCKLQLDKWKEFMRQTDTLTEKEIPFLFFFHFNDYKELNYLLRRDRFDHPVVVDVADSLNKLNHFPDEMAFQTFLLDKDNKVVVIGNPVNNPSVKQLYLKQISEKKTTTPSETLITTAEVETTNIDLGKFPYTESKTAIFTLKNTGENPLVIIDTSTTCGCASVNFDKHPANPGETLQVEITMSPTESGFFDETISVLCNTEQMIKLKIRGQAL